MLSLEEIDTWSALLWSFFTYKNFVHDMCMRERVAFMPLSTADAGFWTRGLFLRTSSSTVLIALSLSWERT